MIYIDTSALVAVLTTEPDYERVSDWLANARESFATSGWVAAEFAAALSIKVRRGEIGAVIRDGALQQFTERTTESFVSLPIGPGEFRLAAEFGGAHVLGLRAGDALHLAVARSGGVQLATLDRIQAEAGRKLGIDTILL